MSTPSQNPSSRQLRSSNKFSAGEIPTRTTRKKDKVTGEVIWTHALEACLVEALRAYDGESDAGNAPRCRFVSNYIYKKTGISRTSTQISSRIQQMGRGASPDLVKVLHKGKRKSPARKNFFRVDSVSPAPNQCDQNMFINYPVQENSPASTSGTSDIDHGTPLQQSTQLGNWTTRDTEYYCPDTLPNIGTSTGQYSDGNLPSEADFEYINMLTAMDGMHSPSYGDQPGIPNIQPVNPYYMEQQNFAYQSYQNQQQAFMAYPYFNASVPLGTGQVTYGVDGPFTQYGDEHRGAHHTG
ncbi:hypothetical protein F5887DRAFT_518269 [Amanita rubescens]|nr:hypothetical protein F5887DRAFT_518269 [Amanita rubescens]